MIYTKTITEPAGGSAGSPHQTDLFLTYGLIYQFECFFPLGSGGLLHVAVFDGGYQLWPSEPGETFFGHNQLVSFPDRYFITSPRQALTVLSYNLDEKYPHLFQLRIGQVSADAFIKSFLPSMSMDSIESLVAETIAAQETAKAERVEALSKITKGL